MINLLFILSVTQLAIVMDSPADVTLIKHYSTAPAMVAIVLIVRPIATDQIVNVVGNSFTNGKIIIAFPAIVMRQVINHLHFSSLAHCNPIKNMTDLIISRNRL